MLVLRRWTRRRASFRVETDINIGVVTRTWCDGTDWRLSQYPCLACPITRLHTEVWTFAYLRVLPHLVQQAMHMSDGERCTLTSKIIK
jgi:hypothetical protein